MRGSTRPGSGKSSSRRSPPNSAASSQRSSNQEIACRGDVRLVVGEAQLEVGEEAGAGQVGGGDEGYAGVVGAPEQISLAVQKATGEAAHLDLGPPQPLLDGGQPLRRAGWRKAGEIALILQRHELSAEAVDRRRLGAEAGVGSRAKQQPHRPAVEDLGEMVQSAEVDVAGGDGERMLGADVADQVGERRRMAGVLRRGCRAVRGVTSVSQARRSAAEPPRGSPRARRRR